MRKNNGFNSSRLFLLYWLSALVMSLWANSAMAEYDFYNAELTKLPPMTDWMNNIPDDVPVKFLSIPGTHLSLSQEKNFEKSYQALSLSEQLNSGIRYIEFDIQRVTDHLIADGGFALEETRRCIKTGKSNGKVVCREYSKERYPVICRYKADSTFGKSCKEAFLVHDLPRHNFGEYTNFYDLIAQLGTFTKNHPSETILVKLSRAQKDVLPERTLDSLLQSTINSHSDVVWEPNGSEPTLKDVRGKIVLLDDTKEAHDIPLGLDYSKFSVQGDYWMSSNWALYGRWEQVKKQLKLACDFGVNLKNCTKSKTGSIVNYLTGWGNSFHYFVASGKSSPQNNAPRLITGKTTPGWNDDEDFPRISCALPHTCTIAFAGTNELTANYISQNKPSYVGIVVADFPGHDFIKSIISVNDEYSKQFEK